MALVESWEASSIVSGWFDISLLCSQLEAMINENERKCCPCQERD
jgi:hypothetical protein